jgi:hypothetical protein
LREIDEIMTEPRAKSDAGGLSRIARPHQTKARSSPRCWDEPQRLHEARIDADPFERTPERTELDFPIGRLIEVL